MASPAGWKLPERIVELSVAKEWNQAVKEWRPDGVDFDDWGTHRCLCGHAPIVELCYIKNINNGRIAIVGNHCIQRFKKGDAGYAAFAAVPRIIAASRKIFDNPRYASANLDLIRLAFLKGVFNDHDYEFYTDIWRKRSLSGPQEERKAHLNEKLLYGIIHRIEILYEKLVQNPRSLAGHKLIDRAVARGVLTEKNREFYLSLWNMPYCSTPTERQQKYRNDLNQRMIDKLKDLRPPEDAPPVGRKRRRD